MTNETNEPDWMEDLLRQQAPAYIADDGFTANVLSALPRPRRVPVGVRAAVLLSSALLACLVAFVILPGGTHLWQAISDLVALASSDFTNLSWAAVPVAALVLVGLLIWGTAAAATSDA